MMRFGPWIVYERDLYARVPREVWICDEKWGESTAAGFRRLDGAQARYPRGHH